MCPRGQEGGADLQRRCRRLRHGRPDLRGAVPGRLDAGLRHRRRGGARRVGHQRLRGAGGRAAHARLLLDLAERPAHALARDRAAARRGGGGRLRGGSLQPEERAAHPADRAGAAALPAAPAAGHAGGGGQVGLPPARAHRVHHACPHERVRHRHADDGAHRQQPHLRAARPHGHAARLCQQVRPGRWRQHAQRREARPLAVDRPAGLDGQPARRPCRRRERRRAGGAAPPARRLHRGRAGRTGRGRRKPAAAPLEETQE